MLADLGGPRGVVFAWSVGLGADRKPLVAIDLSEAAATPVAFCNFYNSDIPFCKQIAKRPMHSPPCPLSLLQFDCI